MKRHFRSIGPIFCITALTTILLASCGGGGAAGPGGGAKKFAVGGTVSGLTGNGLVLQNNGGDDLPIDAGATSFIFSAKISNQESFKVMVMSQPTNPAQTCTVSKGTGTISGADVTNIEIVCSTNTFSVSGTVSGLNGSGLVLQNNSGDDLLITSTSFTFPVRVADMAGYNVTVKTQPSSPNQTCTVNSGTGTVSDSDIVNVSVLCSTNTYSVGGSVSGLTGAGLVLWNNGGDDLAIISNGAFTFTTAVVDNAAYSVTVKTQPTSQTCSVTGDLGTISGAAVTNVSVSCVANPAVISTQPGSDARLVPISSRVMVNFNKAMDQTSINASSLVLTPTAGGPALSGTVSYDSVNKRVVLTPGAALMPGTSYTATLGDMLDADGITLSSLPTWSFTTAGTANRLSIDLPYLNRDAAIAVNSAGDALVAWTVNHGNSFDIVAARYAAASQTWSAEQTISSETLLSGWTAPTVAVVSNGTGFLVAWLNASNQIAASIYSGGGFSSVALLGASSTTPKLASNGSGYAVAWNTGVGYATLNAAVFDGAVWTNSTISSSTDGSCVLAANASAYAIAYTVQKSVYVTLNAGAGWGSATYLAPPSQPSGFYSLSLSLAASTSGFGIVWNYGALGYAGEAAVYAAAVYASGSWSASRYLDSNSNDGYPLIASNGSGYAVALVELGSGALKACVYTGSWSSLASVSSIGSSTTRGIRLSGAASSYALQWVDSGNLLASTWNGTNWLAPATLDSTGTVVFSSGNLVSNGTTHMAIWNRTSDSRSLVSIYSGGWSTSFLDNAGPSAGPVAAALPSGVYLAAWSESDHVRARRYAGSWGSSTDLVTNLSQGGDCTSPVAARAGANTIVVWEQYLRGQKSVQAAVRSAGVWGSPFTVADTGKTPDVASNGTSFVVTWQQSDNIYARRFDIGSGTWGATMLIRDTVNQCSTPHIASNDSGYMLMWAEYAGPVFTWVSSADGITWTTPTAVPGGSGATNYKLVGAGSRFAYMYVNTSYYNVYGAIFDGTAWSYSHWLGAIGYSEAPQVVPGPGGFLFVWANSPGISAVLHNGTSWGSTESVSTSGSSPSLAATAGSFLVGWSDGWSRERTSGTWSSALKSPAAAMGPLASVGQTYATALATSDGSYKSLISQAYAKGTWSASDGYLEGHTGDVSAIQLAGGDAFSLAWRRAIPASSDGEIWGLTDDAP